jgi:hypothetical protein
MALGRDTISQRIALEGSEEIKKQLDAIAGTAEETFKKLQEAANAPNSSLGGLSDAISKFRSIAASGLKEAGDNFSRISNAAKEFGHSLSEVGERVFPHFREVLAVGVGLSIAEFIHLAEAAGQTARSIEQGAKLTGLSTIEYQALGNAAKAAGVDQDTFTNSLGRLNKALGLASEQSRDKLLELGSKLFADVQASGVQVLAGGKSATSKLVEGSSEAIALLQPLARKLYDDFVEGARRFSTSTTQVAIPSFNFILQKLKELNDTKGGEALRKFADQEGVILPAKTFGEVLERLRITSGDLTARLTALGVKTKEIGKDGRESMRPLIDILQDFGRALDRLPNASERAAAGQAILGRSWQQLLKVLQDFGGDTHKVVEEFTKFNVAIDAFALKEGKALDEALVNAGTAASNLKTNLVLAFAPVLIPLIEAFTSAIAGNAHSVQEFAKSLAETAKPAIEDFSSLLKGVRPEHLQTDFVKNLVSGFETLSAVARGVAFAFNLLGSAVQAVVDLFNYLFGTNISGRVLLIVGLIGQLTGIFGAITSAATFFWTILGAIGSAFGWVFTLATGLTVSQAALGALSIAFNAFLGIIAAIVAIIGWPATLIIGLVALAAAIISLTGYWGELKTAVIDAFNFINYYINYAIGLLEKFLGLKQTAATGSNLVAPNDATGQGGAPFASGGLIRGPGTGTSDQVPLWGSNGEFMQRAAAVSFYGLDFMQAINSMRLPKFATGGAIGAIRPAALAAGGAGGPSSAITLVIGEEVYSGLTAPERVASRLGRHAAARRVTAAGRKPSWKN